VWESVTDNIKSVIKEMFGGSGGKIAEDKETW